MKIFLLSLFLLSCFAGTSQAQSVSADIPVSTDETSASADGLDQDLREEFTSRLEKRYNSMSLKELEKHKKYVEKQIKKKADSKNASLKEKLNIELEVINEAIEQAKQPKEAQQ